MLWQVEPAEQLAVASGISGTMNGAHKVGGEFTVTIDDQNFVGKTPVLVY